jgi:hypothetical protein
MMWLAVLRIRIRCLFDPWIRYPGWIKKIRIRIRNEQPESYFGLKYLEFFDAVPGSEMEKNRIRDKHPGSATPVAGYVEALFD